MRKFLRELNLQYISGELIQCEPVALCKCFCTDIQIFVVWDLYFSAIYRYKRWSKTIVPEKRVEWIGFWDVNPKHNLSSIIVCELRQSKIFTQLMLVTNSKSRPVQNKVVFCFSSGRRIFDNTDNKTQLKCKIRRCLVSGGGAIHGGGVGGRWALLA